MSLAAPDRAAAPSAAVKKSHPYPFWSPRFWHGMRFGDFCGLMADHPLRIHPLRWPMALILAGVTPCNSALALLQRLIYGRRIRETTIDQPPLFIVGHWRSGTTYLHELMVLDQRYAYPTTYQCFAPHHFLVTETWLAGCTSFLLPRQRPMDDMLAGWDRPQEDEFALLAAGIPTPYRRLAFPNEGPAHLEYLDMQGIPPSDLDAWQSALCGFIRLLTLRYGRPLILKSPPHTGRVGILAETLPGAKFVHITRHPFAIFSSTRRLWRTLDEIQSFQRPNAAYAQQLDEYVLAAFERMYAGFHRQREQLPPHTLCDVRYEDLVREPLAQLERVYTHLELGDFAAVRPKIAAYVERHQDYRASGHRLDPHVQDEVFRRWREYFERYGYSRQWDPERLPDAMTMPSTTKMVPRIP